MKPRYFCSLLAKNYLPKVLALYHSLHKCIPDFYLYILCIDDKTYSVLSRLNLPRVELISLDDLHNTDLNKFRATRTVGEFCWTCSPTLILYLLNKYKKIDLIGYIDADLFFYSSPENIYREFDHKSIMIVPHRHAPEYKYLEYRHGIYNVGLLLFRRDQNAMKALKYWSNKCFESCSVEPTINTYGDQKYLNSFPKLFHGVHILKNIGADIAPWNITQYKLTKVDNKIYINGMPLIFLHAADVQIYSNNTFKAIGNDSFFSISKEIETMVYSPYYKELINSIDLIKLVEPNFNSGIIVKTSTFNYRKILSYIKRIAFISNMINHIKIKMISGNTPYSEKLTPVQIPSYLINNKRYANKDNEITGNLPFSIQKLYWNINTHPNSVFGSVAFTQTEIIVFCLKGSCVVNLDNGVSKQTIILNKEQTGIHIPKLVWFSIDRFTNRSMIMLGSNDDLKDSQRIYSYEKFLKFVRHV